MNVENFTEEVGRAQYNSIWHFRGHYSVAKASELVPCSLLPHWNSMRFFATVSLSD